MTARRTSARAGFSLIEAIVALVVLGVAMPPMLFALAQANRDRVGPVQASRARWLAIERLEDVVADRASSARGYTYVVEGNYPDESSVSGFPGFQRSVAIAETAPDFSAGTGAKTVTVAVSWQNLSGDTVSLQVATVFTELP